MGETLQMLFMQEDAIALCLVFSIPIFGIIGGTIIVVTKSIIRHRERMAMIQQGFNPDELRDEDEKETGE
ncbi:MAG: hypothetical protein JW818_11385 [Pirellulales bacterium]|nr:hypothetical protein [Pirellulales bacterium]